MLTVLTSCYTRWCPTFLLTFLLPATGMAMTCKTQGAGETVIRADLSSSVAIPATLPDGSAVWRSERLNIPVECSRNQPGGAEEVFLYLNPENLQIGQGIRAGLTLNGVDYVQAQGRIPTQQLLPACSNAGENLKACPSVSFSLPFSVFIQKFGPTPPSGVASDLTDYRMFQIDGASGMTPVPDSNLNYVINNLGGLRFVACDAELRVMPETVEFGDVAIRNVRVGEVATFQRFALATSRTCDSPFSLNARFTPVSGTLSGDVLIPVNNDSIGIRITNAITDQPVPYHEPFHITDLPEGNYSATADFNAELIWQNSVPRPGPFSAELMVDLFYK
ncbi:fimbrial protein [Pseudomonas sp. LS-2]|uniref:fimbrial protein n=1 Tax=Pseudomonas sp. LS-2 TaxID=2315859 RepID=UPI000E7523F7|nr:fimbrial protein [Pseudomonas sp. LS-2]RJX81537.1 fimbrial protein [Pseudomonas sp. LS-2]